MWWKNDKPKTAITPVFIRGVAVLAFASILYYFGNCAIFFLFCFFDDRPHICFRDEFVICSETEGCVQCICQFRAFVGRNVTGEFF